MNDSIFYHPDISNCQQLPEQESQHCIKVLRMKEGDCLSVVDGCGNFYYCQLVQAHPRHCLVKILDVKKQEYGRDFKITVAFAPTKQMDRNEWFIEKAVEIGVDRFIPLKCDFSERKEIKLDRLTKIMVSAMKQSKQAFLPTLEEMTPFQQFVSQPFEGQKYIAHCYSSDKSVFSKICKKGKDTLILIGPEGDFSESEVQMAVENGFEAISLGNNRLRTETACLTALHTVHVVNSI